MDAALDTGLTAVKRAESRPFCDALCDFPEKQGSLLSNPLDAVSMNLVARLSFDYQVDLGRRGLMSDSQRRHYRLLAVVGRQELTRHIVAGASERAEEFWLDYPKTSMRQIEERGESAMSYSAILEAWASACMRRKRLQITNGARYSSKKGKPNVAIISSPR